jgi:hypothetical protein
MVISNLRTVSSSPRTVINRRTVTEDTTAEVTSLDLRSIAAATMVSLLMANPKTPATARLPTVDPSSDREDLPMVLVSEDQVDTATKTRALTDQRTGLGRLSMEVMAVLPGTTSRLPLTSTEDRDTVEIMTAMALPGTR